MDAIGDDRLEWEWQREDCNRMVKEMAVTTKEEMDMRRVEQIRKGGEAKSIDAK